MHIEKRIKYKMDKNYWGLQLGLLSLIFHYNDLLKISV